MNRRGRAIAFLVLALLAAVLAAAIAERYGTQVSRGYGPLREVVVVTHALDRDRPLRPRDVATALERRRVPGRFVPAGALRAPAEALGLAPAADLPSGSYLLAAQLAPPAVHGRTAATLDPRRHPVEISVGGADALLATDPASRRTKVDVIVTTEPSAAGRGRTYIAASGVPLLSLGPGADGPGPGGSSAATLALTRRQALRLIAAESFARRLTLLPEG